ncbi:LacI family DNA-binding transcriptional regulator [Paenibacillus marinisediminis]
MVTIYDIAKKANCSAMTVSRVINNTGRISDKTRQRVKAIMEEMNYVPNAMARSLVLQETKLLSLLISDITNPFYTTLARGAEDAAKRLGYRLMFSNSDEDTVKESEYVDTVLSARVDGVIIAPAGDSSLPHLEKLRSHNIPFVLVDREVPGIDSDSVLGDSKEGTRRLIEHLLELGHKHIALLNGSLQISTARLREQGYVETLRLHQIEINPQYICEVGYAHSDGDNAVSALLELNPRPTAIFAANNFIALAAIRALRARGLEVPRDMSVVCFDDMEADYVIDPFLTVSSQPAYDFGSMSMQMLVDRIQGTAHDWREVVLPSKLVIRHSSAAPPSEQT